MSPALGDLLKTLEQDAHPPQVTETVLFLRVLLLDAFRKRHPHSWSRGLGQFLHWFAQRVQSHGGTLSQVMADGAVARFRDGEAALRGAIDIQEHLSDRDEESLPPWPHKCVIGLATGEIIPLGMGNSVEIPFGAPVEIASRLCDGAVSGSILLSGSTFLSADLTRIDSQAGRREQRPARGYFLEIPHRVLMGFSEPMELYALFWQSEELRAQAERPFQHIKGMRRLEDALLEESAASRARIFGRVGTIKQERGFGFIQYYTDDDEYREIYFHIAYVIDRVPIREGDHVEFVIKPGKGGRPQACSILVMASRIQGQVETFDAHSGAGTITIRDHDSEVIVFHVFRQEVPDEEIRINDIVEFTVASGSETEGLVALDVRLFGGRRASPHAGTGDNLRIGHVERALVTTYSAEKGYGFAKCRRNSIYVHVSELVDPEQIPAQGDLIEFEVAPGRNGTYRATDVRILARRAELATTGDPHLLTSCG